MKPITIDLEQCPTFLNKNKGLGMSPRIMLFLFKKVGHRGKCNFLLQYQWFLKIWSVTFMNWVPKPISSVELLIKIKFIYKLIYGI
jgi:hypothetical protein